MSFLELEFV